MHIDEILKKKDSPAPVFLTLHDLIERTSLSRSTILGLIAKGEFPQPIRLTANRCVYLEAELIEWQNAAIARNRAS